MPKDVPSIEILAPAGDEEMMRAAVFSGADCVYLGFSGLNARRGAGNFDAEALQKAVAFCHARNCKVYVALNTLVFPGKEQAFAAGVAAAAASGCDAIIVQDLAAVPVVRQVAPGLPLHASTQMSVHSVAGAKQLEQLGFSRVILARELHLEEIREIAQKTSIELEVFVHGALCVSVSGQCYFSAFLGGRSGNRGGCAGPCRLPFCMEGENGRAGTSAKEEFALSLRDLSILRHLPTLAKMGVKAAKIEGRLRGPEYGAAVCTAARAAREGKEYEEAFLEKIFSRDAFTEGWFAQKSGKEMFGHRTEGDNLLRRKQLPKARELYRREMPRVPVTLTLQLRESGAVLAVSDGANTVEEWLEEPLETAQNEGEEALRTVLAKTGGTPFFAEEVQVQTDGWHLPGAQAAALRRVALDALLAQCERVEGVDTEVLHTGLLAPGRGREKQPRRTISGLRARFTSLRQVPQDAWQRCTEVLLPLSQWGKVPENRREKTRLYLPRVLFGEEESRAAEEIQKAAQGGFLGFEAQNIAHLGLCRGQPLTAGFGLNVTNALAAGLLENSGCEAVTLSLEMSLQQMQALLQAEEGKSLRLDVIAYGHLPLVVTRACPLKGEKGCRGCDKKRNLLDRKGKNFTLVCEGETRTLYNPVPLWMGDRLRELPADTATLYFTEESSERAQEVLAAFLEGVPAKGPFTRGLYDRGTQQ